MMVVWPQQFATPKISDSQNFTVRSLKELPYHPFDITNPTIAEVLKELLTFMF